MQKLHEHNDVLYPSYAEMSDEKHIERLMLAKSMFEKSFQEIKLDITKHYIEFHLVSDAIARTDQRKLHYLMYHDGMMMNELKQIAVFSFWILRLKPIHRLAGGPIDVNEQVVLNWFFRAVISYRNKKGIPQKSILVS